MRERLPEEFRDLGYSSEKDDGHNGLFWIPGPTGTYTLKVICSDGGGWDHVSVSLRGRCPNWPEMCFIKDLFFEPHETVVQFHPSIEEYVNLHPYCLHIWRDQSQIHTLPPFWMVGPKARDNQEEKTQADDRSE